MDQMAGRLRRAHDFRQLLPLLLLCLSQLLFVVHDTGHLHDHDAADSCQICLIGGNALYGGADSLPIASPIPQFAGVDPEPAQQRFSRRLSDYRSRAPPASV